MVAQASIVGKRIFICEACSYVYDEQKLASKCESYCKANKSCSLEITAKSMGVIDNA